jgi:hypothetical protein
MRLPQVPQIIIAENSMNKGELSMAYYQESSKDQADWGFAAFIVVILAVAVALTCVAIYMQ